MLGKNVKTLDKLIKKAGSVEGRSLDSVRAVVDRCIVLKLCSMLGNHSHPLHHGWSEEQSQ